MFGKWISIILLVAGGWGAQAGETPFDPYKVLGVSRQASNKEIKRAFRDLQLRYHPDADPDDRERLAKFKRIEAAYILIHDGGARQAFEFKKQVRLEQSERNPIEGQESIIDGHLNRFVDALNELIVDFPKKRFSSHMIEETNALLQPFYLSKQLMLPKLVERMIWDADRGPLVLYVVVQHWMKTDEEQIAGLKATIASQIQELDEEVSVARRKHPPEAHPLIQSDYDREKNHLQGLLNVIESSIRKARPASLSEQCSTLLRKIFKARE